jgi:glycosyltransferase involved in cell wall biosynthesis
MAEIGRPRVLFFVEGHTDIRFVVGLSQICDLTMAVPARAYEESGLKARVAASGATLQVHEIAGSRPSFQFRSLVFLWNAVRSFDVVLAQEMLRGSLNATIVGVLQGVPVVTTMALPPVEYFRCRRERRQIGLVRAWLGEALIRTLLSINGRLATTCLALGPYLHGVARRYSARVDTGYYYGVDVNTFRPIGAAERVELRGRLGLPSDRFLVVLSSRISHEKDPETVLRAIAGARAAGLDAVVLNLGGGYQEFLDLARALELPDPSIWVFGRPAVHPMTELADYIRAADVVVQSSLEEGLGLSPLEALACEVPVVATAVGGLVHLREYATLTPRRDAEAITRAVLAIAADVDAARAQARRGREYVRRAWSRDLAFESLRAVLTDIARCPTGPEPGAGGRMTRPPVTPMGGRQEASCSSRT